MSNEASIPSPTPRPRMFPDFDSRRVDHYELALTGKVVLNPDNEVEMEIIRAAKLGARVRITFIGRVVARPHSVKVDKNGTHILTGAKVEMYDVESGARIHGFDVNDD